PSSTSAWMERLSPRSSGAPIRPPPAGRLNLCAPAPPLPPLALDQVGRQSASEGRPPRPDPGDLLPYHDALPPFGGVTGRRSGLPATVIDPTQIRSVTFWRASRILHCDEPRVERV